MLSVWIIANIFCIDNNEQEQSDDFISANEYT